MLCEILCYFCPRILWVYYFRLSQCDAAGAHKMIVEVREIPDPNDYREGTDEMSTMTTSPCTGENTTNPQARHTSMRTTIRRTSPPSPTSSTGIAVHYQDHRHEPTPPFQLRKKRNYMLKLSINKSIIKQSSRVAEAILLFIRERTNNRKSSG